MTREELRRRAFLALNDSPEDPVFWGVHEMNQLIQESQEVLAEEVEAITRVLSIPVRSGVMFYHLQSLGAQVMTPWRLWMHQRQHRLWPISITELDGHYERWLTVTGAPEWWFLLSWDCIGVWPAPAIGGGIFELDCFVWPDPVPQDDYEPEYPDTDHDALLDYLVMEGQVKQWDVARALELAGKFYGKSRDGQARNGIRAVQERFFGRTMRGDDLGR